MTDAVQRQIQAWIGKKWEALDKGKDLFNKIKNEAKLPKKEPRSSTQLNAA